MILTSCSTSLCEQELHNYLGDETNGLIKTHQPDNELELLCVYRPADLLFQGDDTVGINENYHWFKFSLKYTGERPNRFLAYSKLLSEKSVESRNWFNVASDKSAVFLSDVIPNNYFGERPQMDYLLVVSAEKECDKIDIEFDPGGHLPEELRHTFHFSLKDINNIPRLNKNC